MLVSYQSMKRNEHTHTRFPDPKTGGHAYLYSVINVGAQPTAPPSEHTEEHELGGQSENIHEHSLTLQPLGYQDDDVVFFNETSLKKALKSLDIPNFNESQQRGLFAGRGKFGLERFLEEEDGAIYLRGHFSPSKEARFSSPSGLTFYRPPGTNSLAATPAAGETEILRPPRSHNEGDNYSMIDGGAPQTCSSMSHGFGAQMSPTLTKYVESPHPGNSPSGF